MAKEGIHLGPPLRRLGWPVTVLVLVLLAATVVHVGHYWGQRQRVARLRGEVAASEELAGAGPSTSWSEQERWALAALGAVVEAGAPETIAPTRVLALVSSSLPDGVFLVSLSFHGSSSNPNLLVEAVAGDGEDVTELERRVGESSLVVGTRLLEERRTVAGTLSVRLQVALVPDW